MKQKFKIETHLHTTYCSKCGWLGSEPILTAYAKMGYSAICVTDHFNRTTFQYLELPLGLDEDKITPFQLSWRRMRDAAKKYGIHIYRGAELRFDGSESDYLLYNYDPALLADPEAVISGGLPAFYRKLKGTSALLIQAHPFRAGCIPAPPDCVDGYEVYNASLRHENYNDRALAYAIENNLLVLSGSDAHRPEDLRGAAGICMDTLPETDEEFAALIRSRQYTLIRDGSEQPAYESPVI
jgi:predicted metal-dependent phosphoesterase TrpH